MMNVTDDHHADLDVHDHQEEVFSNFEIWIAVPSVTVVVFVMVIGGLANSFIVYTIWRGQIGTAIINPILIAISAKNLLAIVTCLPTAGAMLCFPKIIMKTTCSIQENITLIVLFGGFSYPALLSAVQCDSTYLPFGQKRNPLIIYPTIAVITVMNIVLGIENMYITDTHGCHLWSRRSDEVVMLYIYSTGITACVSFGVTGTAYYLIYKRTSAQEPASRVPRNIAQQTPVDTARTTNAVQSVSNDDRRCDTVRQKRLITILKPMLCIVISNVLFSLPWQLVYTLTIYENLPVQYDQLRIVTMCILYLPIATDPVIFLTFSTKGRNALKVFFKRARVTPVA